MTGKQAASLIACIAGAALLTGCGIIGAAQQGPTLNTTCTVAPSPDYPASEGYPGYEWQATFSNPASNGQDVTVNTYTVVFFGSNGQQTGSQQSASLQPFTVAQGRQLTDTEDHPDMAPVPSGSTTCRVSSWS
jgi:hypothetical protein